MRMESEELRNLPLHMQEQVGVALAEQMEQAAPVADVPSGIAIAGPLAAITYGDYIRQMDDEALADMLVEIQMRTFRNFLNGMADDAEQWKNGLSEMMKKSITELLCPFE